MWAKAREPAPVRASASSTCPQPGGCFGRMRRAAFVGSARLKLPSLSLTQEGRPAGRATPRAWCRCSFGSIRGLPASSTLPENSGARQGWIVARCTRVVAAASPATAPTSARLHRERTSLAGIADGVTRLSACCPIIWRPGFRAPCQRSSGSWLPPNAPAACRPVPMHCAPIRSACPARCAGCAGGWPGCTRCCRSSWRWCRSTCRAARRRSRPFTSGSSLSRRQVRWWIRRWCGCAICSASTWARWPFPSDCATTAPVPVSTRAGSNNTRGLTRRQMLRRVATPSIKWSPIP